MKETLLKAGLLVLVALTFAIGYGGAQLLRPEGIIVTTPLDDLIPFIDVFVIFYIAYFPLLLVPVVLYWKDWKEYKRLLLAYVAVILISVAFYLLVQTEVVRPQVEGTNAFRQLVLAFYRGDSPVNALPSLHVSLSLLAALFVWQRDRRLGWPVAFLAALVILSTMLIKQHAVADVLGGLALGGGIYWFIQRKGFKFSGKV